MGEQSLAPLILEKFKILNIDDNEVTRYSLGRVLTRLGFEVQEAQTGFEGLKRAQEQPDLVILDVMLPDINGHEVCRKLKNNSNTSTIPVLQVSAAHTSALAQAQGLESGADAYLTHPIDPDVLAATVRALLRVREAERKMRNAEERLTRILEAAGVGTWDWDAQSGLIQWNEVESRLFDFPPDVSSVPFQRMLSRIHPEDQRRVEKVFKRAIDRQLDYQVEFRVNHLDGKTRWLLGKGKAHYSKIDKSTHISGINSDISDRKDWENALRQSEERFRLLANMIPQMVWITGKDGTIEFRNHRWTEYTGLKSSEQDYWKATIHPDDLERVIDAWEHSLKTGDAFEFEYRVRRHDGCYRWYIHRALAIRDQLGEISLWFGTSTDIEDQKQIQEKERFLSKASQELSSCLDYKLTLRMVARLSIPLFADWCAIDLLDEKGLPRRIVVEHVRPEMREMAEGHESHVTPYHSAKWISEVLQSGQLFIKNEINQTELENPVDAESLVSAVQGLGVYSVLILPIQARGKTLGAFSFAYADSKRIYSEDDLVYLKSLAERAGLAVENAKLFQETQAAVQIRDDLLAIVSHDLKNPLTAIDLKAGLIVRGAGVVADWENQVKKYAESIHQSARRMKRLIDDLLDLTRIKSGHFVIAPHLTDFNSMCSEAMEMLLPLAVQKNVELNWEIESHLPVVSVDRDRLVQVISNIIGNAIKFTPAGGKIRFKACRKNKEILCSISDTGPGIHADQVPRLFDRYWQADHTAKLGTGLGLSISKGIVEAHGGKIWAESIVGMGSTFYFTLPI